MSKIKPTQALGIWIITVFVLYLVASLFSVSTSMDNWNGFSKFIFWIPTIILLVWTLNDYFIKK